MAVYLFRINWLWDDAVVTGGDTVVWGYHLESSVAPSAFDLGQDFEGAFTTAGTTQLQDIIPTALEVVSYQVYDVAIGGPPIDEALPTAGMSGLGGAGGPTEVMLVVSRWVDDGLGRPFKKGRSYIGPLAQINLNSPRPGSALRTVALDYSVALHNNFLLHVDAVVVDTKGALHVPQTITQYSVDDAWDTQRRRGIDPTTQEIRVP